MTVKRLTELVPQKAIVDGTLLVTIVREDANGQVVVETGHGSIVVDKTRLTVLA